MLLSFPEIVYKFEGMDEPNPPGNEIPQAPGVSIGFVFSVISLVLLTLSMYVPFAVAEDFTYFQVAVYVLSGSAFLVALFLNVKNNKAEPAQEKAFNYWAGWAGAFMGLPGVYFIFFIAHFWPFAVLIAMTLWLLGRANRCVIK